MNTSVSSGALPGRHVLTGWIFVGFLSSVLLVVALLRNQSSDSSQDQAPVLWQMQLRFEDRPNGDVAVLDAHTQAEITRFEGEQGFVRGVLRTLSRERMRRGIGSGPAFELVAHSDGRLTLLDPATEHRIYLESFGPGNMSHFAKLHYLTTSSPQPHQD